jgi:outer membrane protein TolC
VLQTIFDGGRRRAEQQSAQFNYDAVVATYRESALDAFQQVEDNLAALRVLEKESQTQAAAVEAAQRSLELSTNRYTGGLVTYLEVVTAQSAALDNERLALDILPAHGFERAADQSAGRRLGRIEDAETGGLMFVDSRMLH